VARPNGVSRCGPNETGALNRHGIRQEAREDYHYGNLCETLVQAAMSMFAALERCAQAHYAIARHDRCH